jgi:hypothetical protein
MPDMLEMTAGEFRNPMMGLVQLVTDNTLLHVISG